MSLVRVFSNLFSKIPIYKAVPQKQQSAEEQKTVRSSSISTEVFEMVIPFWP